MAAAPMRTLVRMAAERTDEDRRAVRGKGKFPFKVMTKSLGLNP
jgi:hypothetical protein